MKTGLFLSYHFNQVVWSGLDWLFPPVCGGCNRPGSRWCAFCQQQVQVMTPPLCDICGLPLRKAGICPECRQSRPHFTQASAWLVYDGPIRHALHTLKYRRNISLGETLANAMADHINGLNWEVDIVVPVPLGRQRLRERGYNQVSLVAKPLAALKGWDFTSHSLVRLYETRSQVGLSLAERKRNVEGAFRAAAGKIQGKNVFLMDDVATTGATLSSCALALLQAGAEKVFGFTIAKVLPQHGFMIV
jgi:competence protein ComFC